MKNLLKRFWPVILIFVVVVSIYLVYQFYWIGSARLAGNDGYYYLARAKLILENGLAAGGTQNYTPFTLWGLLNGDNTLIYVLFITPLALFSNPIIAAKIFSSLLIGFFAILVFWLSNRVVKNKYFSLALIFGAIFLNIGFFLKFTEIRALTIGIPLYFLTLYEILIYKKHYWLLIPLAFLYVYFHTSAYLMFLPLTLLVLFERKKSTLVHIIKLCGYIIIGMALAFITFPTNSFLQIYSTQVIIPILYLGASFSIDGGYENKGDWRTPDNLIISNAFNIILFVVAISLFVIKVKKKIKWNNLKTSVVIIFILMVLLDLVSRRFLEYMAPSAIIFAIIFNIEIKHLIKTTILIIKRSIKIKFVLIMVLLLGIIFGGYKLYTKYLQNDVNDVNYKGEAKTNLPETWGVADYINKNIPKGDFIYNDAWEDFPSLFYKAPGYKYAAGMELGFLYLYDPTMLNFYQEFRAGDSLPNAIQIIKEKFKSNYLLIKKGSTEKSIDLITGNNLVIKLYDDNYYSLFSL